MGGVMERFHAVAFLWKASVWLPFGSGRDDKMAHPYGVASQDAASAYYAAGILRCGVR